MKLQLVNLSAAADWNLVWKRLDRFYPCVPIHWWQVCDRTTIWIKVLYIRHRNCFNEADGPKEICCSAILQPFQTFNWVYYCAGVLRDGSSEGDLMLPAQKYKFIAIKTKKIHTGVVLFFTFNHRQWMFCCCGYKIYLQSSWQHPSRKAREKDIKSEIWSDIKGTIFLLVILEYFIEFHCEVGTEDNSNLQIYSHFLGEK